MKVVQNKINPYYSVDANGSIKIESIKDESIFNFAKKCDKDNNNILESDEIAKFLEKYSAIRENNNSQVYYEQKNKNGQLLKKCLSIKKDNSQIIFFYKNGKAQNCILTLSEGERYVLNLKGGISKLYYDKSNKEEFFPFKLDKKSQWKFKRISEEKPYNFANIYSEIIYRILHWDWD